MKLTKLKLRNRSNGNSHNIPTTPHGALIQEAISVTRKLDALRKFPNNKLTGAAYLAESLEADPHATMAGVKKLRVALGKHPPSLEHTQRTLMRMMAGLRSPNYPRPPTSKYPGRLVTAFSTPQADAELIRYGSNIVELFAVAVSMVSERHSELFGTCESSAKHAAQVAELEERQHELFEEIETRVGGDDLVISDDPKQPASFKAGGGKVPLAPRQDSGQRLIAYLMAQREQREKAN